MSAPVRLLDLGAVPPLRSQALYHGLAAATALDSPDTIAFLRPASPHFCVGLHQHPADELDLAWCRRQGYPVLQRRIGGGTVYLDGDQLFYQCVFHRSRAPFAVASIYRALLGPPVEALRRLGLPARLRGVNEIEVGACRIAGTGGGQIGDAVVVVGNLLWDFPCAVMARAWRVPSAAFRRLALDGLERHLTTLTRELGQPPPMAEAAGLLADCYGEALGRPLVPGDLTARERQAVARAEADLASGPPVRRPTGGGERQLKLARDTYVREVVSANLRLTVRLREGAIEALALSPVRPPTGVRPRVETGPDGGQQDAADLAGALRAVAGLGA